MTEGRIVWQWHKSQLKSDVWQLSQSMDMDNDLNTMNRHGDYFIKLLWLF